MERLATEGYVALFIDFDPAHRIPAGRRSDLPLFAEVGLAIALNATPAARAAAHVSVDGTDLRAVLPLLGAWLDAPHTSWQ